MANIKKQQQKIEKELIAKTAVKASIDVSGVDSVKDVKVAFNDKGEVELNVFVVCTYGIKIPDLAFNVQNKVKEEVEKISTMELSKVDITIYGVKLSKE